MLPSFQMEWITEVGYPGGQKKSLNPKGLGILLVKKTRLAVSAKNNLPTRVNRWVPTQRGSTPFVQFGTKPNREVCSLPPENKLPKIKV